MIVKDKKVVIAAFWNNKTITAIYKGHKLI